MRACTGTSGGVESGAAVHAGRLESVRAVLGAGAGEDPLDNEEQVADQMDALPYMCRFQYEHAAQRIAARMDPLLAAYSKVRARARPATTPLHAPPAGRDMAHSPLLCLM